MLNQTFGGKCLHQITPKMVEDYKAQRKVGFSQKTKRMLSPATVNRELACLKTMFKKAVEWEMTETNPVTKVKLLREPKGRLRFLTEEEAERLVECSNDHLRPIVVTALNTGMRLGEILKLKWEEVDFENQIVYVTDSKNGEQRQMPMNNLLTDALQGIKLGSLPLMCFAEAMASFMQMSGDLLRQQKRRLALRTFTFTTYGTPLPQDWL